MFRKPLTREAKFALVVVLLSLPMAAAEQHSGRQTSTTGATTSPAGQPESPDVITLERAVALQARPDQRAQFQEAAKSTATACTQAHGLQQHGTDADSVDLFRNATQLRDAVEDAQSDNRKFVNSLSDVQVSGLKKFTAALSKANAAVTRESKTLAAQLDKTPVDTGRLLGTAGQLEKALTAFQSAQNHLAQEMGIPQR